jgi:hypothetical protein
MYLGACFEGVRACCVVFVMCLADNSLGPLGVQCVAAALSVLTGLQTLDLQSTGLCLLLLCGWLGIV